MSDNPGFDHGGPLQPGNTNHEPLTGFPVTTFTREQWDLMRELGASRPGDTYIDEETDDE